MALDLVFSPIQIGPVTLSNRIVRTAHGTGFGHAGISEQFIAFHAERARGGCALSILEASAVDPSSVLDGHPILFRDDIVESYQRLMAEVNPHGMKVFQQIWHGGNLYQAANGPPLAVSTVPSYTGIVGKPMSEDEIYGIIDSFARATTNARAGGLHGVEVHGAHGYLFQQFLSPFYNNREDGWGGDLRGRMRILLETLRAVRKAAAGEIAVGVRLSASEAPGGVSEQDNQIILKAIQAEGLCDYVNVSKGDYFRSDTMVGTMHNPLGYELSSATQVLEVAKVPRIVAGRIRTLEEADQLLREGVADMISMVRAHIADPQIVNKTRSGRIDEVRPCIACNQGCVGGQYRTGKIGCLVNPAVGFETQLSERFISQAAKPKKVLVVGGGPAGMETARVAALEGHQVVLAEASPDLGGLINLAKRAPKLHTLGDIGYWLEQEIYRLGVEVRLNTYMDADDVRAEGADVVVVATGSQPRMDGFQHDDPGEPTRGVELKHVISSIDLMSGAAPLSGKTALVFDSVGHYEAIAVSEQLMSQGVSVTLLTSLNSFTPYVQGTMRDIPALERLYALGDFNLLTRHRLIEIQAGQCLVRPSQASENQSRLVPADTVVLVTHNEPQRELFDALRKGPTPVHLIGDANSPRDVQWAITEGHRLARSLN